LDIQTEEIVYDTPPTVKVSNQNFIFAVKTVPPSLPYYYFTLSYKQYDRNVMYNIELEQCTIAHF